MFEARTCRSSPPSRRLVRHGLPGLPGCLLLAASIVFHPPPGAAQTDADVNAGIQFNFTTPGARSLALGGAFVGRADDATAAFTNPAGLVNLTEPQVSTEIRSFTFKNTFTDRGHAFGFATGFGVDTIEGLRPGEAEDDVTSLAFFSFVYPRGVSPLWGESGESEKPTPRWALAVYRHELVSFEGRFRSRGAFFDYLDAPGEAITFRLQPVSAAMELDIVNLGLSAAVRLTQALAIGVGLSHYEFEIDSLQQAFSDLGLDPETGRSLPDDDGPGTPFGPPDYSPSFVLNVSQQRGSDRDFGLNLGFFWQLSDRVSAGGVYRQGPRFAFLATNRAGAFVEIFGIPQGTILNQENARFQVPDVFGLGLAFQASRAIRITVDYNRVEYSALSDDMVSIFGITREPQQAAFDALTIDDGGEARIGFEYAFLDRNPTVYLRFGAWYDPDHKIRFAAEPGIDPDSRFQAVLFQGGDDAIHATAGIGLAFARDFKLDAAVDLADTFDTASLSVVYRFGGSE